MPVDAPKTVSELTAGIKDAVEEHFPAVWVVGEISNCTRASSGHVYLTLKDDRAQIRAVIWRARANQLKFDLHDGLAIVASGPVEVYAARGSYQLIIEQAVPHGVGALELAFRQLQEKLAKEGLFADQRKRPLPRFPQRIVLITSPTGAAVRDFLQVVTRRWAAVDVILIPVAVQGDAAAQQIAAAFRAAADIPDVDVVVAGRGGGSLEDLWAFNEEIVARAIFECPIPVVSAVGHEIDVSIADLVADRRALTPSEAGEIVVPDRRDFIRQLHDTQSRLQAALRQRAHRARQRVEAVAASRSIRRPREIIHDRGIRLDELSERLRREIRGRVETAKHNLGSIAASLTALNPLGVLQRGYSLTRDAKTGEVMRAASDVQENAEIETIFAEGRVISRVETVEPDWRLLHPG